MLRLLNVQDIPSTLWDTNTRALQMPPALASRYVSLLEERGLTKLACSRDSNKPPVGGLSQEDTDKHLAQAFDGSVARAQLALLDPINNVAAVSNMLIRCLSGNNLCLVDVPCGSGAASLAFLCSVAELRHRGIVPRVPLHVSIVGGEISSPARSYAARLIEDVSSNLEDQAIFVSKSFYHWDVTCELSNTNLVREMTLASRNRKILVVVANFSGFLERDGKRREAEPKLRELLRHAAIGSIDAGNGAVWIEPMTNKATSAGGTINWLKNVAATLTSFVLSPGPEDKAVLTSASQFQHLLDKTLRPRVNLAVQSLQLKGNDVNTTTS